MWWFFCHYYICACESKSFVANNVLAFDIKPFIFENISTPWKFGLILWNFFSFVFFVFKCQICMQLWIEFKQHINNNTTFKHMWCEALSYSVKWSQKRSSAKLVNWRCVVSNNVIIVLLLLYTRPWINMFCNKSCFGFWD